ncbi:glycoside hydrolase family 97 N-terminal domain-containing protein [Flammeovirgaceae bacterium SG7u.111]|nr:glycoside hydrolase family 97 N-terminal domain-containing protein [Flammeovirgaceae bacterium SG7u.132]WPO33871.1 glycoside hydrolase family 97 N-terminal domain-containing protein [Flammeovirgaceae bacterium SG7u.111]
MFVKKLFLLLAISVIFLACNKQEEIVVKSPDGSKVFTVFPKLAEADKSGIPFSVQYKGKDVLLPSLLELSSNDLDFSTPFSVKKVEESSIENEWTTRFGERGTIPDNYNQLTIYLENASAKLTLICRAYNEGVAFSYEIPEQNDLGEISLNDEEITYQFAENHAVWSTPKRAPKVLTAQGEYRKIPLASLEEGCERPLVVEVAEDLKIALAEAKLVDYARLSFNASQDVELGITSSLDGKLEAVKQDTITGALAGQRSQQPKVVKTLPFQSPWRVVMMAENHGKLLENNYLIQNLNDACAIADVSWIKSGKVLREGTLTTEGGLAAIDFVASHNMQYVHFDAGWYGNEMDNRSDATTITLDPKRSKGPFDLEAITAYAKEKGVGVMLYVNRRSLEKQLDELLPLFKEWGIAGIKYGFVRVGDQDATAWMHEAIKKAADYQMVVDVHDEYRPTGFSRTYPNFLTQEGIRGDEETVPNQHTLITMFTRSLAGASDNTICYYNKRVEKMGSHASQLAKAVCIFSPLQFLYWYDRAPAAPVKTDALWGDTRTIGNEPELEFFNNVPTTWDETRVLTAEIGEIGVIARRKGSDWFVGGINGLTAKNVEVDFSFLEEGASYSAKFYTDNEAINTRTKVEIKEKAVDSKTKEILDVKANNGFVMHIKQIK